MGFETRKRDLQARENRRFFTPRWGLKLLFLFFALLVLIWILYAPMGFETSFCLCGRCFDVGILYAPMGFETLFLYLVFYLVFYDSLRPDGV